MDFDLTLKLIVAMGYAAILVFGLSGIALLIMMREGGCSTNQSVGGRRRGNPQVALAHVAWDMNEKDFAAFVNHVKGVPGTVVFGRQDSARVLEFPRKNEILFRKFRIGREEILLRKFT